MTCLEPFGLAWSEPKLVVPSLRSMQPSNLSNTVYGVQAMAPWKGLITLFQNSSEQPKRREAVRSPTSDVQVEVRPVELMWVCSFGAGFVEVISLSNFEN